MIEITHINAAVMQDAAWRHVFGRAVEENERGAIRALIAAQLHSTHVAAEELSAAVSLVLNVARPTATKVIARLCDLKTFTCRTDENNETRKLYAFAPGIREKLKGVATLTGQVAQVIAAQLADPSNHEAGLELLEAPIYFNILDPEKTQMYKHTIHNRKMEFRNGRGKGELHHAA